MLSVGPTYRCRLSRKHRPRCRQRRCLPCARGPKPPSVLRASLSRFPILCSVSSTLPSPLGWSHQLKGLSQLLHELPTAAVTNEPPPSSSLQQEFVTLRAWRLRPWYTWVPEAQSGAHGRPRAACRRAPGPFLASSLRPVLRPSARLPLASLSHGALRCSGHVPKSRLTSPSRSP